MGRSKAIQKEGLKPQAVIAYALYRSGVPIPDICKRVQKKESVVYDWIGEIKKLVEKPIPVADLQAAVAALYPMVLQGFMANVKKKDAPTINNFLNKTIFRDVKDVDASQHTNILNVGLGLDRALNEDELAFLEEVRRLIGERDRKEPTPPVVSRL